MGVLRRDGGCFARTAEGGRGRQRVAEGGRGVAAGGNREAGLKNKLNPRSGGEKTR